MATVQRSKIVIAPLDQVWSVIRVFGGLHRWLPGTEEPNRLTGDPEEPGTERHILHEGEVVFAERLLSIDDAAHRISYTITQAPFVVRHHVASITVTEVGEDESRVVWLAEFEADEEQARELDRVMGDQAFAPGLDALQELLTSH